MSKQPPFNPKQVYDKPRGQNILSKSYDMENNCIVRISLNSIGVANTDYDKLTDATESFIKAGLNPVGRILISNWGNDRLDVICTNPADDQNVQDYLYSNPHRPKYLFETYQDDENGTFRSYAKPNLDKKEETVEVSEEKKETVEF